MIPPVPVEEGVEDAVSWMTRFGGPTLKVLGVLFAIGAAIFGVIIRNISVQKDIDYRFQLAKNDFNKDCDCIGVANYSNINFGTYCNKWESTNVYFIKTVHSNDTDDFFISNDGHGSIELVTDSSNKKNRIFEFEKITTTVGINSLKQFKNIKAGYLLSNGYYAIRNPFNPTKYLSAGDTTTFNENDIITTKVIDDNENIAFGCIFFIEFYNGGHYKISIRDQFSKIKYYLTPKNSLVEDSEIILTTVEDDTILWNIERTSEEVIQSEYGWCFIKNPDKCKESYVRDSNGDPHVYPVYETVDGNGIKRMYKKCDACSCRETCINDDQRWGVLNRHWCPVSESCPFYKNYKINNVNNIYPDVDKWRFCDRDTEMTQYTDKHYERVSKNERTKYLAALKQYDNLPNEYKFEEGIFSKSSFINIYKITLALNYEYYQTRMQTGVQKFVLEKKIFKSNSLCDLDRFEYTDGLYYFRDPRNTKYYLNAFSTSGDDEKDSVHMATFEEIPHFFYIRKIQKIENEYYYNIVDVIEKKIINLDGSDIKLIKDKYTSWKMEFIRHEKDTDLPYTTCVTKIIKYTLPSIQDSNSYLSRAPNYESMDKTNLEISTEVGNNNDWELIKLM